MTIESTYAVIDLGSSQIRGMLARKTSDGRVIPVEYYATPAGNAIRHGVVYNINDAAEAIRYILKKLNASLHNEHEIKRVHIGLGGQSLRSHEHTASFVMPNLQPSEITQQHLQQLENEVRARTFEGQSVLSVLPPLYVVNGKTENAPKGILCSRFEAHYRIITARTTFLQAIYTVVEDRLGLKVAAIHPTPLCEAEMVLTEEEKMLGAAYVNIGSGCTSVTVFQGGVPQLLRVIPLGGNNITKDLTNLRITHEDAEKIKVDFASYKYDSSKIKTINLQSEAGIGVRSLRMIDIYMRVHTRMTEITANFNRILGDYYEGKKPLRSIVVGGGGSLLSEYREHLTEEYKEVRFASLLPEKVQYEEADAHSYQQLACLGLAYVAQGTSIGFIAGNFKENLFDSQVSQAATTSKGSSEETAPIETAISSGSVITVTEEEAPRHSGNKTDSFSEKKNETRDDAGSSGRSSWAKRLSESFRKATGKLGELLDDNDEYDN